METRRIRIKLKGGIRTIFRNWFADRPPFGSTIQHIIFWFSLFLPFNAGWIQVLIVLSLWSLSSIARRLVTQTQGKNSRTYETIRKNNKINVGQTVPMLLIYTWIRLDPTNLAGSGKNHSESVQNHFGPWQMRIHFWNKTILTTWSNLTFSHTMLNIKNKKFL